MKTMWGTDVKINNLQCNYIIIFQSWFYYCIKTHSSVSAAKKTTGDVQHTSVSFTGTVKFSNSALRISKTTEPISTKVIYFLPYIYTTLHIKIKGNPFSTSWDICSWKLPDFLHIFLHTIFIFKLHKNNFTWFEFFSNLEY